MDENERDLGTPFDVNRIPNEMWDSLNLEEREEAPSEHEMFQLEVKSQLARVRLRAKSSLSRNLEPRRLDVPSNEIFMSVRSFVRELGSDTSHSK